MCLPSFLVFTSLLRITFAVLQKPGQGNFGKFQGTGERVGLAVLKKDRCFLKIPKWQHKLARDYKRRKLVSYFLNNGAKACLYGLKISENISFSLKLPQRLKRKYTSVNQRYLALLGEYWYIEKQICSKIRENDFSDINNQFLIHKMDTQWNSLNRKFSVSLVWFYHPLKGEKWKISHLHDYWSEKMLCKEKLFFNSTYSNLAITRLVVKVLNLVSLHESETKSLSCRETKFKTLLLIQWLQELNMMN